MLKGIQKAKKELMDKIDILDKSGLIGILDSGDWRS